MKRTKISRADLAKYPHLQKRIEKEAAIEQRDTAPAPAPAPESKEPESKWKRFGAALGSAARGMQSGMKQYGEWVDKKNKEYEARQGGETEKPPKKERSPSRDRDYWPASSGGRTRSRRDVSPQVVVIRDRDYDRADEQPIIIRRREAPRKQPRVIYLDDDDDDDGFDEPIIIRRKKKPVRDETQKKRHPAEDIFDSDKTLEFLGYDMSPRRKR